MAEIVKKDGLSALLDRFEGFTDDEQKMKTLKTFIDASLSRPVKGSKPVSLGLDPTNLARITMSADETDPDDSSVEQEVEEVEAPVVVESENAEEDLGEGTSKGKGRA